MIGLSALLGLALLTGLSHSRDPGFGQITPSRELSDAKGVAPLRTPPIAGALPPDRRAGDSEIAHERSDLVDWVSAAVEAPPPARAEFAMAYDSTRGRVVLFGGLGHSALADT